MTTNTYNIMNKIIGSKGQSTVINFMIENKKFKICTPDDELFGAVKDILLNKEYEYVDSFDLTNFKNKTVVDAGAHVGFFSVIASVFAKKVISVEANNSNYKLLEYNRKLNNINNMQTFNKALWFENRKIKFYKGNHSGGSSCLPNKYVKTSNYINTITLDEIIKKFGEIDLLKIDIEGSEFEIFNHISKKTLRRINFIVGEIHLKRGNFIDLKKILENNNFEVKSFYRPIIKRRKTYNIKIEKLRKLKILSKILYMGSNITTIRDRSFLVLFARNKETRKCIKNSMVKNNE